MASVAIVHDHIVQWGGSERVLLAMGRALPEAPILTSFFGQDTTLPELSDLDIRPLALNRWRFLRRHHRFVLPMFPLLFSRMKVDADVTICGTSGWAQGVHASGRKILYFHSLANWLYRTEHYVSGTSLTQRLGLSVLRPWLRRWDQRSGRSADRWLAYGSSMQRRVANAYGVDVDVLPPPMNLDPDGPAREVPGISPGYYLCATRLVVYKNPEQVVEAFRELPSERLVLAGTGPELERLRSLAPPNVTVMGNADNEQIRWLYANCVALIAAGYEPYGLTPVEAAAFGKGTIAFANDGLLDTVRPGTGIFFSTPDPPAIRDAVKRFRTDEVDAGALAELVSIHTETRFAASLRRIVNEAAP